MEMTMKKYPEDIGAFSRKLEPFVATSAEKALLSEFSNHRRRMDAGEEIVSSEQPPRFAYILHEGWASAYREMSNGTRQIFDFRLPGDFLGLLSLVMHRLDYNVVTLTEVVVSEVSMDKLISTFRQSPLLSQAVIWSLSRDAAIIAEHLVNIGRRGALERTVHLLIEIGYRLNQVGQSPPDSYECPLTQKDLAEALGITHVHLNRVLRQLRSDGLLSFNGHMVTLHDLPALMRIAEFEPSYLQTR